MTWTIEISLIDLIIRHIAGIGAIIGFILIIREQRKTKKFLKEERSKEMYSMTDKTVLNNIKKTEVYAEMVMSLGEDAVHEMIQQSIKDNTTPACCYRCAKSDTCKVSGLAPWGMVCAACILDESGAKDTNKMKYFDEKLIIITGKTCGGSRSAYSGYVNIDDITVKIELTNADIMAIGRRYFELCQEEGDKQ